ncbi:alpha/beta hydrolase fold domain-containing protein [Actinomadura fibrosa]|uniref:Alpha/beta hydrolase fold domain-containing protein n=1 Tax=Actinomadura fibrosa TaxID=111802 RepID=A0ABW2XQ17_9ACTN|nr:alpha/beta hydrolase fold domain-containing protein [Actinomadura fibrosa]
MDGETARPTAATGSSAAPPLHLLTPAEARERVRQGDALCSGGPRLHTVDDITIPVDGAAVSARVYRPGPGTAPCTMVYFHGGGWVTGDLEYSDELCRHLAHDTGCVVVSVGYRLAPEHPFPVPFTDAYTSLAWAADKVAAGGPLAVGGDSAGGNLAAACALHARDRGGPRLEFQLLVYPVTDHDFTRPSYTRSAAFPLGAEAMRWFWDHYAADPAIRDDPALSPLRAASLAGLPPAHIVLAGRDPLHDEGAAYAERLRAADVPVSLREYPALGHGFFRLTGAVDAARDALPELTAAVAAALAPALAPGTTARPGRARLPGRQIPGTAGVRPKKTAELLAQRIVADIDRRGNTVGDRLPPEREMLLAYGVGRGTLREALRFLELQGVISLKPGPGGGPVVQRPDAGNLAAALTLLLQFSGAPFRTIAEARSGLEPMMARLAAERMSPGHLTDLRSSVDVMGANLADQAVFLEENKRFHDVIAHGSGNALFGHMVDALLGILDGSAIGIDYPEARRSAVHRAHLRIYEAIASRDPAASAGAMTLHIDEYIRYAERKFPEVLAAPIVWGALS